MIGLYPKRPSAYLQQKQFPPAGPHVLTGIAPFNPAEQALVPYVLWRRGADVYHSPHLTLPYASRRGLVLTVHDLNPWFHPEDARSQAAALYYRYAFPRAIRRADAVVAVSDSVAAEVAQHFAVRGRSVAVVPHGIGPEWRPRPETEIRGVLLELGVSRPYLLYVGTAKRWKNLETLVKALRPEFPPLVLAGPTTGDLASLPGTTDARVIALGPVGHEMPALYNGASALLMPSRTESVGFPVLEAMASGTPVIISDAPGLVNTAGQAAISVPAMDVSAWRAAIERVMSDPALRSELAARGLSRVRDRTWRVAAEQYLKVYESVALA